MLMSLCVQTYIWTLYVIFSCKITQKPQETRTTAAPEHQHTQLSRQLLLKKENIFFGRQTRKKIIL